MLRLLHRFSDPVYLGAQQADEEERQFLLRETGYAYEPPGEPERQEAAPDRSIDRKVRILLRLRKELTNPQIAAPDQAGGGRVEEIEGAPTNDIMPYTTQPVEALENSKMKERSGNVFENKGSRLENRKRSGNPIEKKAVMRSSREFR